MHVAEAERANRWSTHVTSTNIVKMGYEQRNINHTIYFNEDMKKMLLKLSKDISIHAIWKKNEVSCDKFWVDYNSE